MGQNINLKEQTENIKIILTNRKARFEYEILEKYEVGVVLKGTEVKSVRETKISLQESYATFTKDGELFLEGCTIQHYSHGNIANHDISRPKKLLLHKREIQKLRQRVQEKGLTIVPLQVYLKGNKIKLEIGIGRGKKLYDKRETIKQRDLQRNRNDD